MLLKYLHVKIASFSNVSVNQMQIRPYYYKKNTNNALKMFVCGKIVLEIINIVLHNLKST